MKDPHDIIIGPIVSERSYIMANEERRYQFKVAIDATKIEIAKALESIYQKDKISVNKVNTSVVKGKTKRLGRGLPGKKPDWKKATVTLGAGQQIGDFTI